MDDAYTDERRSDSLRDINVLLVGIGGYGEKYVKELLQDDKAAEVGVRVAGVVDPFPERCSSLNLISEKGIPVFDSIDEFYRNGNAELAVISTPIHLHVEQIITCLSKDSNVLCEKPVCPVYQDTRRLSDAEKKYGRFVAIGYQLSFSPVIQELKADIMSGKLGKPLKLKAIEMMPRGISYYSRNGWAGKKKTDSGKWILDSPVNNSSAHQLHNMLYLLGKTADTSAVPVSVTAELYRANEYIQNYDTAALRCTIEENSEILFYTSHANKGRKNYGPLYSFEFEKAVVTYNEDDNEGLCARFGDGSVKCYGDNLRATHELKKLWDSIAAARGKGPVLCGIEAATSQVLCMNGAQESMPEIIDVNSRHVGKEDDGGKAGTFLGGEKNYIHDIKEIFETCLRDAKLPNEIGVAWAKPGKKIDLRNYKGYI